MQTKQQLVVTVCDRSCASAQSTCQSVQWYKTASTIGQSAQQRTTPSVRGAERDFGLLTTTECAIVRLSDVQLCLAYGYPETCNSSTFFHNGACLVECPPSYFGDSNLFPPQCSSMLLPLIILCSSLLTTVATDCTKVQHCVDTTCHNRSSSQCGACADGYVLFQRRPWDVCHGE